jgi:hypothetical protein
VLRQIALATGRRGDVLGVAVHDQESDHGSEGGRFRLGQEGAMASARGTGLNPLLRDPLLFDMFMAALDEVVAEPEIRGALDEFRLTPQNLRGRMVTAAAQVLRAAPREFAAYEAALEDVGSTSVTGTVIPPVLDVSRVLTLFVSQSDDGALRLQRWIGRGLAVCGALFVAAGVASMSAWPWTEPLLWSGAAMLCLAGLVYGLLWLSGEGWLRLLRGTAGRPSAAPAVEQARDRLMAALTSDEFLAQARTFINTARQDQFGHDYAVSSIAGLSETYDATYQVSTSTAAELDGLLARLDGASIGVAGPRGSGKSTLIRGYCEGAAPSLPEATAGGSHAAGARQAVATARDLRCMVSAPVDYAARDFVLHLFATFCRAVIQRSQATKTLPRPRIPAAARLRAMRPAARMAFFAGSAIALVHWQRPVAGYTRLPADWVFCAGIAIALAVNGRIAAATARNARLVPETKHAADGGRVLAAMARQHLIRVRYLQTRTSGWSGMVGLAPGSGGLSLSSSRAEQPLSYPEIVSEFRDFARAVAAEIHRGGSRVFIGIDELDKIGTPEQAERFLNEIKGIFGIPHVYFMVSVSDDALNAFERRGLPLRDAFDSSFDEIIEVTALNYPESRRLLYRRVIGLTEPYVALCHCLSGGLARDLIRAARQVTRAAQTLSSGTRHIPDEQDEDAAAFAYQILRQDHVRQTPVLSTVCTLVVTGDLRRKLRAVARLAATTESGQARDLQHKLSTAARYLQADERALMIVETLSQPVNDEPDAVAALRLDLAAYFYYCATLQDVFTANLNATQITKATATGSPGSFDALAAARQAFTLDPHLAWRSITEFRQAWTLEIRDPPATQ